MSRRTCVLGLGLMGRRAARRLAEQGHDVVAWNRSPLETIADLADVVTLASSPREAVSEAALVLLFLHDADAVEDVLLNSGAAQSLAPGCLVVDMGTNNPGAARHIAAQLPGSVRFVDAPVSGGTKGAEQGTLSIFLGAKDEDVAAAQAALGDLGQVSHMGGPGTGQAAKLANQIVVACSIAGLAEGVAYGEALGIEPDTLVAAMRGGLAESQILETIGQRICTQDFTPHGRASTHLKDLDYAFSQIERAADSLPVARGAQKHLQDLLKDFGDLDHSAMVLSARAALAGTGNELRSEHKEKPMPQDLEP